MSKIEIEIFAKAENQILTTKSKIFRAKVRVRALSFPELGLG